MTSLLERGPDDAPIYALPPEAYYDVGWYEREQRRLFGRTWNLVGHVSEIPAAGDFLTAKVGTEPVVVVRGEDGELRGFLNICRHRGMVIAGGTGNCGSSLRCRYHGWEFALDGELVRVPQRASQFPDLDPAALGLFAVSVGVWGGFVFVHPDPAAAASFDDWLGDIPEHCGAYPWDTLVEISRFRVPLRCNWKLYIENHIDWLHLWYLHQESLGMYEHHDANYSTSALHWYSAERLRPGEERESRAGMLPIPGVGEEELRTLRANLMFPNVPFSTLGSMVQTYQVVPTGAETCELDIRSYGTPGAVVTDEIRGLGLVILRDEDGDACEQMQAAIHSSRFEVGPLAFDHERPIADFHRNLLTFLA